MKAKWLRALLLAVLLSLAWTSSWAQNTVLITPVGSHTGEFCRNDRALIFEDPSGLRILYDPGRTVTGGTDTRLGNINVMLLSHVHVDHIGEKAISAVDVGNCGDDTAAVPKAPNSNFAEIAAAKGSTVLVGGEMHTFLDGKIDAAAGVNTNQTQVLRPGGKQTISGVTFATVAAKHSNGVDRVFLTNPPADNLTAYVGPEQGYVITFSNGLVVYLSGDTGVISDMDTVVRQQYRAELAVINIGDTFSTGPEEAAFAINKLIKPKAVIPSHANEEATSGGMVKAGTKTQRFIDLVGGAKVHVPLSGVAMEFTANGTCINGC